MQAAGAPVPDRSHSVDHGADICVDGTVDRGPVALAPGLTRVLESMSLAFCSLDRDWRYTYVNARAELVLGVRREDLLGGLFWDLFPSAVGTPFETHYREAMDGRRAVTFRAHYPAPLDAWYELTADGSDEGLAVYFTDITDRVTAQEAAERSGRRVFDLGRVALALAGSDDITALVATMAEQGLRALGADGGAVAVPDPDAPDHLWSSITASYGEGVQADYGHMPTDAPLPVCEAYTSGRRLLLPDGETASGYSTSMADVVASTGCQAWACVPLRAGGEVIGVLTAGWEASQDFDAEQLDLLETLASQCSQALQRLAAREAEHSATLAAHRSASAAALAAARQSTLVGIARALGAADSEEVVLAVAATQGIHLLDANGCGLCLLEHDGTQVRTLVTDSYSDVRPQVQLVPVDFPLPAIHSAATGTPHFLGDREQTEARFPGSRDIYTTTGVQASAALPLHARGRLLGCLSVGFAEPRAWPSGDRDLLEAFAALVAQALERISSHDAEVAANAEVARFSETLQRSLLTSPPEPDHLHIAVRYSPAAQQAQVGGDWYDAFITADGSTSLVIGDVTGHDRTAAAAMGQLRNLLRGIAYAVGDPPAAILAVLDRAVHDLAVDTTATLVLARLEQTPEQHRIGERLLRWSNAGHPPPLLLSPTGAASYLEAAPDLVLGIAPDIPRHDHQVLLAPDSTVLLYTDGLIERRGAPLQQGLDWLAATAEELAHLAVDELCDELLALVGDRVEDDVALLAVRAHPEDEPRPAVAGPGYDPRQEPVVDVVTGG